MFRNFQELRDGMPQSPARADSQVRTILADADSTLRLSPRDIKAFIEAILNPPDPNERLRLAFRRVTGE